MWHNIVYSPVGLETFVCCFETFICLRSAFFRSHFIHWFVITRFVFYSLSFWNSFYGSCGFDLRRIIGLSIWKVVQKRHILTARLTIFHAPVVPEILPFFFPASFPVHACMCVRETGRGVAQERERERDKMSFSGFSLLPYSFAFMRLSQTV